MANVCEYHVRVKGKKNACYAFYGSMSVYDYKDIQEEHGTDDEYEMTFTGTCKWSVDSYCTPFDGEKPVELPDDFNEAYEKAENDYWYNTVQERSEMFQVEVWCNSADIEDYDPDEGPYQIYEHYLNGDACGDEYDVPEDLKISVEDYFEDWDDEE